MTTPGARGTDTTERYMQFQQPSPFQGMWANDVTYERGDVVRLFDGGQWRSYRCKDRTSTAPLDDPGSHWQQLVYSDPPILMWHAFQFDGIHPDDPAVNQITTVDLSADPAGGSGSYDVRVTVDQVPSATFVATINFDDITDDITAALLSAMGGTFDVEGTPQNYTIEFGDTFAGVAVTVTIENNTLLDGGAAPIDIVVGGTQTANPSALPAPLGSIIIGQGIALTEGYAYIKVANGVNDWTVIPTEHPTEFIGTSAGSEFFTVAQGTGDVFTGGSSYGWQQATLGNKGGPTSQYTAWGIIEFDPGTAGENGQPVICDFGPFLNGVDDVPGLGSAYGSEFRGGVGLPIGHAVVKIGGVTEPEPYHIIMVSSSFGGTVVAFVDPAGTPLGIDGALAEGDVIEFQITCMITTD